MKQEVRTRGFCLWSWNLDDTDEDEICVPPELKPFKMVLIMLNITVAAQSIIFVEWSATTYILYTRHIMKGTPPVPSHEKLTMQQGTAHPSMYYHKREQSCYNTSLQFLPSTFTHVNMSATYRLYKISANYIFRVFVALWLYVLIKQVNKQNIYIKHVWLVYLIYAEIQ